MSSSTGFSLRRPVLCAHASCCALSPGLRRATARRNKKQVPHCLSADSLTTTGYGDPVTHSHGVYTLAISYDHTNACTDFSESPKTTDHRVLGAYTPTNYDPNANPPVFPSEDSIQQDLQVLREAGFTGLVTYGASGTLGTAVPGRAEERGFHALIMAICSPTDAVERANAVRQHSSTR